MVDRGRDRRSDILTAAEAEFGDSGFAGGRVERIAASARVNKQLLFHYFGSKEALYVAALESLLARVDTPPAGPHSPAEALRQLLRFISATSQENPRLRAIIADAHFNRACPPTAVTRVRQWVAGLASAAERLITEGQRSGHFRELDARGVAGAAISTALWSEPGAEDMVLDFCTWH